MKLVNSYVLNGEDGKTYVVSDMLEEISFLGDFMQQVLTCDETYYKTIVRRDGGVRQRVSKLGWHLPQLKRYAHLYDERYAFNPAISFFFEVYRSHRIRYCVDLSPRHVLENGESVVNVFDDFLAELRWHAVAVGLKKAIADWRSKSKKNMQRLQDFERQLFERYGRVGVIRLDLEYRSATFTEDQVLEFMRATEQAKEVQSEAYYSTGDKGRAEPMKGVVPFEQVQRDRTKLFANRKGKPSLFKHMVAYATRIECTPLAGYHLHVVLFFNGAQVQKLDWLAQQIGEYWNKEITGGHGRFHNCNYDWKESDPNCGIGMVSHDDTEKRANLVNRVLSYLAKDEQHVDVLPYKGCNLFTSGFTHRDRSKGRGRPRTKGLSVSNQPLGGTA